MEERVRDGLAVQSLFELEQLLAVLDGEEGDERILDGGGRVAGLEGGVAGLDGLVGRRNVGADDDVDVRVQLLHGKISLEWWGLARSIPQGGRLLGASVCQRSRIYSGTGRERVSPLHLSRIGVNGGTRTHSRLLHKQVPFPAGYAHHARKPREAYASGRLDSSRISSQ